jgi:hypothetical protein
MKIMAMLGVGGSFSEYYAIDFISDLVLMGHDGPGHIGIAQDKIRVRPLQAYHGKVGNGLSVEMSMKQGPITLLSVVKEKEHGLSYWSQRAKVSLARSSRSAIQIAGIAFRLEHAVLLNRELPWPGTSLRDRRGACCRTVCEGREFVQPWFHSGLLRCPQLHEVTRH